MQMRTRSMLAALAGLALVAMPSPVTQGQGATSQLTRHVDIGVFGADSDLETADALIVEKVAMEKVGRPTASKPAG